MARPVLHPLKMRSMKTSFGSTTCEALVCTPTMTSLGLQNRLLIADGKLFHKSDEQRDRI